MRSSAELLSRALQENQIVLPAATCAQLLNYLDLMVTWNRVTNLTAITSLREMIYLHLIDSLTLLPLLADQDRNPYLDVGSGAGLPGMVLAIANPDQQWVLMDKNSKKTRFLTQVVAELGLSNVKVMHARAESVKVNNFNSIKNATECNPRGGLGFSVESITCFNTIVARAVASLKELIETTQHLLGRRGILLAMKGKYPHAELAEIQTADLNKHWLIQSVTPLTMKGMEIERHVVCIQAKY